MRKSKGFTLVELLATIVVITLVMGIAVPYVISVINSSKDKTTNISLNNIKDSARYYVKESPNEVIWTDKEDEYGNLSNESFTCVSIDTLINKGYFKENDVKELDVYKNKINIIVNKNSNEAISSEEFDKNNICNSRKNVVPIPTSKICNNPTYSGSPNIIAASDDERIVLSNNTGIDAGIYQVEAILNNDIERVWEDGTKGNKNVVCSINRAIPRVELSSNGATGTEIGSTNITLTSNVSGTISIKSSNIDHAEASVDNNTIIKNVDKNITIVTKSSRNTATYITITVIPNEVDSKNYYSNSAVYTLANIKTKEISPPNSSLCADNLVYNGTNLKLTKNYTGGYTLSGNNGTNAGTYTITAKLRYGFVWNDRSYNDKTFTCTIAKATPIIRINPEKGEVIKTTSMDVTATAVSPTSTKGVFSTIQNDTYVSSSISTPNNTTSTKITITGNEVTDNTNITIKFSPVDKNNYNDISIDFPLKVLTNIFTVKYDCNGGTKPSGKLGDQTATFNKNFTVSSDLCSKTGYNQPVNSEWKDPTNVSWKKAWSGKWTYKNGQYGINNNILVLKANWSANVYTINYTCNGGTCSGTKSGTYNSDVSISNPSKTVTVKGDANGTGATVGSNTSATQTFSGWTSSSSNGLGSGAKSGTTAKPTAAWNGSSTKNTHFMNLRATTGTITMVANWTAVAVKLPTLSKTGYTCNWYTEKTGGTLMGKGGANWTPSSTSSASVTAYARCEVNEVNVVFKSNYTKGPKDVTATYTYGVSNQKFNSGFTRTGYHGIGWATSASGDKVYNWESGVSNDWINSNAGKTVTLYAKWDYNYLNITYNVNGASMASDHDKKLSIKSNVVYSSNDVLTSNIKYENANTTIGSSGLVNYNNSKYLNVTRTGYHIDSNEVWSYNGKNFDQDTEYKLTDICSSIATNSCNVTMTLNWKVNVCTIKFDDNGGKFNKNSDNKTQTVDYGKKINLWDAADSDGHFKASRTGYSLNSKKAWINGKTTYNEDSDYEATDICTSLGSGNQSVTLKANWIDNIDPTCTIKKTTTYSTGGVDFTVTCSDSGSGCRSKDTACNTSSKKCKDGVTTSWSNAKSDITYAVYDNEGNKGTCKLNVSSQTQKRYHKKHRVCNNTESCTNANWDGTGCSGGTIKGGRCCISSSSCSNVCYSSGNWGSWGGSNNGCGSDSRTLYY